MSTFKIRPWLFHKAWEEAAEKKNKEYNSRNRMKLFITIMIILCSGCLGRSNSNQSEAILPNAIDLPVVDSFLLAGNVNAKTLYFSDTTVFYISMDSATKHSVKAYSLARRKLKWSVSVEDYGITPGVITSQDEYVIPTLSPYVYLINDFLLSNVSCRICE